MRAIAKLNWKLLLAVPLLVSCLLIGVGGPARPILVGALFGIVLRIVFTLAAGS